MATTDLLSAVLSTEGWYCIVGLKKKGLPKQIFVATLQEADTEIATLLQKQYDVYFACSKYENHNTRTTDNVKNIKAFWLDIDCGEDKPYEDQAEGATALLTFCKTLGLPKPTIVNSGRGLHVYWPLISAVPRLEWKRVAEKLKKLCVDHNLQADPARTSDAASILRVPETLNFKSDPPAQVQLQHLSQPVDFEAFKTLLGVSDTDGDGPDYATSNLNELTKALMGNRQSRFQTIWLKTEQGEGCAQIKHAVDNQDSLEEPLWRGALSIAAYCVDSDTAVHEISKQHPNYSAQETENKVKLIKGPYTCEVFNKNNPGICESCQHWGQIKSPIVLGAEIAEATPADNVVQVTPPAAFMPVVYTIPEYPFPYFRGKTGGVYCRPAEEGEDPDLIYEHDFYVVKRMRDPEYGEVVWMRLHTPRDGVKEFALAAMELLSKEKLRDRLSYYGIVALPKQMDSIMVYIVRFTKELQFKHEAEIMRTQFGWTDKFRSFVVGDTEICADADKYSPPSSYTQDLSQWFEPQGTLEEWQSVINVYNNPGFEPHAFGFFTAFGAPLMKLLNLKGAVINLINNESGTGKTTTLKAMHSVYGHPEELMLIQRDTMNVRLHRLGVMNNLGLGCDEITKMTADDFSDFVYAVSQGRGRGRMKANSNEERKNFARWETILLCSSNASVVDKLKSLVASADGELMRVIEYEIPPVKLLSKEEADDIYPKLYANYGHAGRIYIRDLVSNLEERLEEVRQIQKIIDKKVGFTNRERFWSGVAACNIAGALFARRLGLFDIDVGRVFKWMLTLFGDMKEEIKPPLTSQASIIGEFWNVNRNNTLVINGEVDKRTGVELLPILEPRGELILRMEPDTMKLFIAATALRKYCTEHRITLKDVLTSLTAEGVYGGMIKKRMSKGTKLSAVPPIDAYVFDCSRGDFLDPDVFIAAAQHGLENPEAQEDVAEPAEEATKDAD